MGLSFGFWQKWLLAVSLYITLFGIVLAFAGQSSLMDWAFNDQINKVFWSEGLGPETARYQAWIYGVLGATLIGWGLCLVFLSIYPFANRETWVWICITVAMTAWFVLDTSLSLYYGAVDNAGFNSMLYVFFMAPLVFTRKQFFEQISS